jgi:anti-anti-sigma factor
VIVEPLYTIRESSQDGLVRLALEGEFDLAGAPTITDRVRGHLTVDTTVGIVIDLSGVTFLDSSGINALLACRKLATDAGVTFHASGARGPVAGVLDLTGVTDYLAGTTPTAGPDPT